MLVAAAVNEDAASGGAGAMPGGAGNIYRSYLCKSCRVHAGPGIHRFAHAVEHTA